MGLRGPTPGPTALKMVRGNPGKRTLNKREPRPKLDTPFFPPHLDEAAKAEWDRLVPILQEMRILTEADYMTLGNLCQAFSTMVKAQEQLNKSGILFKTPSGYVQQSPLISIINQNMDIVTKLCREFGLTPSARSRVTTPAEGKQVDDPWAKLG